MNNTNFNIGPYVPDITCEKIPVRTHSHTPVHAIFALIAFVIGSLWFRWIFVEESILASPYSVSVFIFAIVFSIYTVSFFKLRRANFSADSYLLLALLIVFSLRFCIYTNDYSQITSLAYLVLHLTALLLIYSFGEKKSIDNIVGSIFRSVMVAPFASFYRIFSSFSAFLRIGMGKKQNKESNTKIGTNIGLVLLGVFISLPIVLIVLSLLISDSFFSSFLGNIVNFTFNIDIAEYFNIITILVSMYIFGAMFSADKKRTSPTPMPRNYRFIPNIISNTVTISLVAVYLLFFIAQIDGFICMFTKTLPENTTYAQFARSGFFELCVVSCINGAILYYLNIMTLGNEKKYSGVLQVILVLFTYFLIFTAGSKMLMYISTYGFTVKRFCTLWFMLLLLIILSLVLVKLKRPDFKLSRYCVYVTAVMLLVLFFVDFEGVSESLNGVYFQKNIIT